LTILSNNGEELLGEVSQEVRISPNAMITQIDLKRIDDFSKREWEA
jgi:hypothetical protein